MKAILNLYIYSSLHIAICAMCLTAASYILVDLPIDWDYLIFVGSGTCIIYSLHKIVGISKVSDSIVDNRFQVIRKFRTHLIVYATLASVICLYSFYHLPIAVKYHLIVPCILSLLYVLPLFWKSQRLRDFDYIKIIIISLCWAWLCGFIPLQSVLTNNMELAMFTAEKFLFILAITLPFDYRDRSVDTASGVRTFAHLLGDKILYTILICFILCIAFVLLNPMYEQRTKILLVVVYFILDAITRYSTKRESDYYFSGVIDGTMILFGLLVYFGYGL